MSIFEQIKQSIHEDIKNGAAVEILEETNDSITIYDEEDVIEREYTIVNPVIINSKWLMDKLTITSSTREFGQVDYQSLMNFLDKYLDKQMLMTLQGIVFCNNIEADFDELHKKDEFQNEIEVNNLPGDNTVGMMWYEACKVLVNLGEIIHFTDKMLADGCIYDWEYQNCINEGILTTLVHEIRHLAQANPYLPEEIILLTVDDEKDAENYARTFTEKYGFPSILSIEPNEQKENIEL